jgi:hypothetical protein
MLLQQCEVKTVVLTAIETQCGFQPFFTYASENYTVGMDGWSIDPYSACFWKSHFVNINGNAFAGSITQPVENGLSKIQLYILLI